MQTRIVTIDSDDWASPGSDSAWIEAVEDGKVLYFARLAFALSAREQALLGPLRVTKSLRSEYDHQMLQLHDLMKFDGRYQAEAPQETMGFPPAARGSAFPTRRCMQRCPAST